MKMSSQHLHQELVGTSTHVNIRTKTDQDRVNVLIQALKVTAAGTPQSEMIDSFSEKSEEKVKVFLAFYECYVNGIEFTEDEKQLIAKLVHDSLEGFGAAMPTMALTSTERGSEALKIRSGFQFMVVHFLRRFHSPNVGVSLEELLHPRESLDDWNMTLLGWKFFDYELPRKYDVIPDEIARQYILPDGVPESHFWWKMPIRHQAD